MKYILFFADGGSTTVEAPSFYDAECFAERAGEPDVVGHIEFEHLREVAEGMAELSAILYPDGL